MPPSFSIVPIVVALNDNVPFDRRLAEPDIASPWTDVADPRFVLAGARLAARASDPRTAAVEHARFLELWRDADSGVQELAEAR